MPTQEPSQNSSFLKPDRLRRSRPSRPPRPAEPVLTKVLDRTRRAAHIWARATIRAAAGSADPHTGEDGADVQLRAA